MVFAIVKGTGEHEKQLAITTLHEGQYSSCTSSTTVAKVAKNEEIRVIARWADSFLNAKDEHRVPSFSGTLEYKS